MIHYFSQTLTILKLCENKIDADRVQYLAKAFQENTVKSSPIFCFLFSCSLINFHRRSQHFTLAGIKSDRKGQNILEECFNRMK